MKNKIFIFIIISTVIFSCNEEVLLTKVETNTVVNCFFSADDTLRVHLSKTYDLFSEDTVQNIYNADINLFENTVSLGKLIPEGPNEYGIDFRNGYYYYPLQTIEPEKAYRLVYTDENGNIVEATDIAPTPVPIKNTDTTFILDKENSEYKLKCNVVFDDPTNSKNYYAIAIDFYDIDDNNYRPYNNFTCNSSLIEAEISNVPCSQMIFSDKQIDGKEVNIEIISTKQRYSVWDTQINISYKIMLFSISENYYKYAISYYEQILANKDFYSEPQSVYSNITGGYGIFAGYSKSCWEININRELK